MKNFHAFLVSMIARWGLCAMVFLASAMLATKASGQALPSGSGADIATASGMPPTGQAVITRVYTRKYGTDQNDIFSGMTSDSMGNVYICGNSMNGESNGFLRKFSSEGEVLWTKTKSLISIDGVTHDKNGNVYIAGSFKTGASLSIRHSVYLEKYDGDGNLVWAKSFRAAAAPDPTFMVVNGLAMDPSGKGFVIILFERAFWPYQTRQVFIKKYNSTGSPIWEKPAGHSTPYVPRPVLAVGKEGLVYTALNTAALNRFNTTISQFSAQGDPMWTKQFDATPSSVLENYVRAITVDATGNVFVGGVTKANLEGPNLGFFDAFLQKYGKTGDVLWTKQFGTSANDYANSLTVDAAGDIYLAGSSSGSISITNRGSFDAVLRKYDGNGSLLHSRQFGGTEFDIAIGINADAFGDIYVAGHTNGVIGGPSIGLQDVFLRKFSVSP